MAKIYYFPGCEPRKQSYNDLIEDLIDVLLKTTSNTFIDYRFEMGPAAVWYDSIEQFLLDMVPLNATWEGIQPELQFWRKTWRQNIIKLIEKERGYI